MHDATELIQALVAAAWPAIVFFVIWTYREPVSSIIASAKHREWSIEVGGQKLSMAEANQQQQTQIGDLQQQLNALKAKIDGFQVAPEAALNDEVANVASASAVLWVDDNPKNNSYFIELLQKRGFRVDLARSTSEGMNCFATNSYRAIISDMGRTEDGRYNSDAGLDLLEELRKQRATAPVVFFCSERAAVNFRERAQALGAKAITASTTELRALLDQIAPAGRGSS